jgi:hypothetical protein
MQHIEVRKLRLNTLTVGNKQYDFNCGEFKFGDTMPITIPASLSGRSYDITGVGRLYGPAIIKAT